MATLNVPSDFEISYADDDAPVAIVNPPPAPTVRQSIPLVDDASVSAEGAARAKSDEEQARALGFSPAPPVFQIGTKVNAIGVANFRQSRAEWAALPSLPELARTFETRIAAEQRIVYGVSKGGAVFEASFKVIDAQFPPYDQVIPKEYAKLATVDRKAMIAALKRAKALCSETRGALLRTAEGKLVIVADHPDNGSTSEALRAEGEWVERGGSMKLGVNASYLIEALEEIACKHVTLSFGGELEPILVRGTDDQTEYSVSMSRQLEVIMPMRI